MNVSNSSRAEKVWGLDGGHPRLTVSNMLNYTRIERSYEVRKKTFVVYYVAGISCPITGEQTGTPDKR